MAANAEFHRVTPRNLTLSFVRLGDDLLDTLDRRISPYLIQPPDSKDTEDGHWYLRLHDDGLSLLPTALNVRMASWPSGREAAVRRVADTIATFGKTLLHQ